MNSIIERETLESLSNLESSPHDTVAFLIIGDVLYGNQEKDFVHRLNIKRQMKQSLNVESEFG